MGLYTPINDLAGLQLAAAYAAGSGSMVLVAGQGARITAVPTLLTAITAATYQQAAETKASYAVSAVAGDVLTVAVADGYADRDFAAGDYLDCRPEAGYIDGLNSRVEANTTALNGVPSGVLKGSGGALAAAVAGTDYVVPSGSITGSAGTLTGSIAESQVTGLVSDLAALGSEIAAKGTVSSVGFSAPAWLAVSGTPVTGSGTIALAAATGQSPNRVLATPDGASGAIGLRAIAGGDLAAVGSAGEILYQSGAGAAGASGLVISSTGLPNLPATSDPSAVAGDIWSSSLASALSYCRASGLVQRLGGAIYRGGGFAAVANSGTWSSLLTSPAWSSGSLTIPAGALVAGSRLAFSWVGQYSTASSGPGVQFRLLLGGTAALQAPTVTAAGSQSGSLVTQLRQAEILFPAVGSGGQASGYGDLIFLSGPAFANQWYLSPQGSQSGSPVAINTSVSLAIDLQILWGTASASNSIQLLAFAVYLD